MHDLQLKNNTINLLNGFCVHCILAGHCKNFWDGAAAFRQHERLESNAMLASSHVKQ